MDQTLTIKRGREGTRETVGVIEVLAHRAMAHPSIIRKARAIVRYIAERDRAGEIIALGRWVRSHVRYATEGVETIQNPVEMLQEISDYGVVVGDCDDHVVLFSALAKSLAIPIRYQTLSQRRDHLMGHILIEARDQHGRWIPVELILKNKPIGYQPTKGVLARERAMPRGHTIVRQPTGRPSSRRRRRNHFADALYDLGVEPRIVSPGIGGWLDDLLKSTTSTGRVAESTKADSGADASATATTSTPSITSALESVLKKAPELYKSYREDRLTEELKKIVAQKKVVEDQKQQVQRISFGTPRPANGDNMAAGEGRFPLKIILPVALFGLLAWTQMGRKPRRRRTRR